MSFLNIKTDVTDKGEEKVCATIPDEDLTLAKVNHARMIREAIKTS